MRSPLMQGSGGFMPTKGFLLPGMESIPGTPIIDRVRRSDSIDEDLLKRMASVQRGEILGDEALKTIAQFQMESRNVNRGITTGTPNLPIRENLEAEARQLIPADTPLRSRLPRHVGAGTAVEWRQLVSTGGGWGTALDQPGGVSTKRVFFGETGAPEEIVSVYDAKSSAYKLMGEIRDVSGFAAAAGQTFENQFLRERNSAIVNTMLNEENALTNGSSTSTASPWGDGTNALGFDGIINLIATANGTPAAQVQAAVGALTEAHMDAQLNRLWLQGARGLWILANIQETQSMVNLAKASGTIIRVQAVGDMNATGLGVSIKGIVHNASGELVPVMTSRFVPAGTLIFGCDNLPDGSPALAVDVLPQVELPALAVNEQVQGYTIQEIAPDRNSPLVYPFIVCVFETLKMYSALHFAKSTGVTAVT